MAKRLSTNYIKNQKAGEPLVCLTAYSAPMAALLDEHCDILLVGDTLGMVIYGYSSTLAVTTEMMALHGKAVVDHSNHACVIVDMPFGSYQAHPEQAFNNAAFLLKETGCQAVKLEGGIEMSETVQFLTSRGIAVMGHVGLQPQSISAYGGSYKARGLTKPEKQRIIEDALAIEAAGAFSIVLEHIPKSLANTITKRLKIPTIGIGASNLCDGQILVTDDMLGLTEKSPKFSKPYTSLAHIIKEAAGRYRQDVRTRAFPEDQHCTLEK